MNGKLLITALGCILIIGKPIQAQEQTEQLRFLLNPSTYEIQNPSIKPDKKTLRGALIGVGIGGLTGGIIGAVAYRECEECWFHPDSRSDAFLTGALLGGIFGGITGIIIGATSNSGDNAKPPFRVSFFRSPISKNVGILQPAVSFRIRMKN